MRTLCKNIVISWLRRRILGGSTFFQDRYQELWLGCPRLERQLYYTSFQYVIKLQSYYIVFFLSSNLSDFLFEAAILSKLLEISYFYIWIICEIIYSSNLSSWKEEALKIQGLIGIQTRGLREYRCDALPTELWSHIFTAMIILHFHLQPPGTSMNYFIHSSHHFTPHERIWTPSPICRFIAHLVEYRTDIRGGYGFESRWSHDFFKLLLPNCLS